MFFVKDNSKKILDIIGVTFQLLASNVSSYDCSSIPNYENLTSDNFLIEVIGVENSGISASWNSGGHTSMSASELIPTKTYDPNTGLLSISNTSQKYTITTSGDSTSRHTFTLTIKFNLYLKKG